MAWTAMMNDFSYQIIILYISAIFWTLAYDTIYGAQDMSDDEIIGIKSTSIKFKNNIKFFTSLSYFLSAVLLIFFFRKFIGMNIPTLFLLIFFLTLVCQILLFDKRVPEKCLKAFKINNLSGLVLFLTIIFLN